jgi:hypothetical protein
MQRGVVLQSQNMRKLVAVLCFEDEEVLGKVPTTVANIIWSASEVLAWGQIIGGVRTEQYREVGTL